MSLNEVLIALCLVAIIEGLGPLLIPNKWRRYLLKIANEPSSSLQTIGAVSVLVGILGLLALL